MCGDRQLTVNVPQLHGLVHVIEAAPEDALLPRLVGGRVVLSQNIQHLPSWHAHASCTRSAAVAMRWPQVRPGPERSARSKACSSSLSETLCHVEVPFRRSTRVSVSGTTCAHIVISSSFGNAW